MTFLYVRKKNGTEQIYNFRSKMIMNRAWYKSYVKEIVWNRI